MAKNILIQPQLYSEKSNILSEKLGKLIFWVNPKANKIEIKNAIESTYGVNVASINTSILPRKRKQRYTKSGVLVGRTTLKKKAFITLEEGETIDLYGDI